MNTVEKIVMGMFGLIAVYIILLNKSGGGSGSASVLTGIGGQVTSLTKALQGRTS
jgi:hypothetical protein